MVTHQELVVDWVATLDILVIPVLVMVVMEVTTAVMVDHLDTPNMVHHTQQESHHMVEVVTVMVVIIKFV